MDAKYFLVIFMMKVSNILGNIHQFTTAHDWCSMYQVDCLCLWEVVSAFTETVSVFQFCLVMQGMTVVKLSATTFPQTLDWLHSYLLEVTTCTRFCLLKEDPVSALVLCLGPRIPCVCWLLLSSNHASYLLLFLLVSCCFNPPLYWKGECVHICSALSRVAVHHQVPGLALDSLQKHASFVFLVMHVALLQPDENSL